MCSCRPSTASYFTPCRRRASTHRSEFRFLEPPREQPDSGLQTYNMRRRLGGRAALLVLRAGRVHRVALHVGRGHGPALLSRGDERHAETLPDASRLRAHAARPICSPFPNVIESGELPGGLPELRVRDRRLHEVRARLAAFALDASAFSHIVAFARCLSAFSVCCFCCLARIGDATETLQG